MPRYTRTRILLTAAFLLAMGVLWYSSHLPASTWPSDPKRLPSIQLNNAGLRIFWHSPSAESHLKSSGVPIARDYYFFVGPTYAQCGPLFSFAGIELGEGFYHDPARLNEYRWLDLPVYPLPITSGIFLALHLYRTRKRPTQGFPISPDGTRV